VKGGLPLFFARLLKSQEKLHLSGVTARVKVRNNWAGIIVRISLDEKIGHTEKLHIAESVARKSDSSNTNGMIVRKNIKTY
jgi:hypothetical protein